MAKRFVKLTERDLHEMIIGAVNQILNESHEGSLEDYDKKMKNDKYWQHVSGKNALTCHPQAEPCKRLGGKKYYGSLKSYMYSHEPEDFEISKDHNV